MKIFVAILALFIGLSAASAASADETNTADSANSSLINYITSSIQLDGQVAIEILQDIRQGGSISNTLEGLEFSVDLAVKAAWMKYNSSSGIEKDNAYSALKDIKNYRQQYPRKVEAINGSEGWERHKQSVIREAEDILNKIE